MWDTFWKLLLLGGAIYCAMGFVGSVEKTEIGLLVVGIICVVNYFKGSFETDSKRVVFSILLLSLLLLWSLFGYLVERAQFYMR